MNVSHTSSQKSVSDPLEDMLKKTGCMELHYQLQDCMAETQDWRKCQKEVQQFKICMSEYQKKNQESYS